MIKTTAMLLEDLSDYQDPFGKIKRLCREQKLFPVSRGIYETNASLSGYLFAPVIYGPSYLSFSYALSRFGLIPEAVHEYTSATCCKGKKKYFSNHFGDYSYRDIPAEAYPFAARLVEENGYMYAIATPEKALCDKLYELNPAKNLKELNALLFDDMRIDPSEFDKLDLSIVEELSEKYHSNNVRLLAKLVRRSKPLTKLWKKKGKLMNKATYFAVFEPSGDGYGVYFPDLPGCVSLGSSFAQANANAQEALGLHLWGLMDDGDDVPVATVPPFADQPESALLSAVTVYPDLVRRGMDNRAVRTNVSLPAWLKKAAEGAGLNYSQVLQEALKERLLQR